MDSNSNGKRGSDIVTAIQSREIVIGAVNNLFTDPKDISLARLHDHEKIMDSKERANKNLIMHRVHEMGIDNNMGLDCILSKVNNSKQIFLSLRWWSDPDLFSKKPSDMSLNEYIEAILIHFNYLILDPPKKSELYSLNRYSLISVKNILSFAKPVLGITNGNRNRITFVKGKQTLTPKLLSAIPIQGGVKDCPILEKDLSLTEALRKLFL